MDALERFKALKARRSELVQLTTGKPSKEELMAAVLLGQELYYYGDRHNSAGYEKMFPSDKRIDTGRVTTQMRQEGQEELDRLEPVFREAQKIVNALEDAKVEREYLEEVAHEANAGLAAAKARVKQAEQTLYEADRQLASFKDPTDGLMDKLDAYLTEHAPEEVKT